MRNRSNCEPRAVGRRLAWQSFTVLMWLAGWASAGQNTWTAFGSLATHINAIVPHPADSGVLYAAGEDGVYESIDGGEWTSISEGLPASTVLSLAIDPQDGNRMYAGLNAGLYTSNDRGQAWALVDAVGPGVLSVAVGPEGIVYAGTLGRGIYVSENSGLDWRPSDDLSASLIFDLTSSAVPGTAYAATASGLYRTQDGGLGWRLLGWDLRQLSVRDIDLSTENEAALFVATFGGGVFKSLDFGVHWTPLNQGLEHLSVRSIEVTGRDQLLYVATSTGGFYRSSDAGQSWNAVNDGLSALTARTTYHADDPALDRLLGAGPALGVFEITFASEPNLQVAAAVADFGEISVGLVQRMIVSLSNTGGADLEISSLSTIRTGPFESRVDAPLVIAAGESLDLEVTFQPQTGGDKADTLTIVSDDPDSPVLEVALRGIGVRADLRVASGLMDFGTVRVGEFADTMLVVTNTGNAAVVLSGASVDEDIFEVVSFELVELPPLASGFIQLRFTPLLPNTTTAKLILTTSEPSQPRFELPLLGVGASPEIEVLPEELLFGNVNLGRDTRLLISIANGGNADLTVSEVEIAGDAFRLERSVSENNPIVIGPGGAQLLDVVFLPLISGAHRGTLTILSDDPDSPLELQLLGTGGALDLTPQTPVNAGTSPVDMIVLDVDGDGDQDLATAADALVHVLLNDGTGAFPEVDRVAYPAADSPFSEWDMPIAIAAAAVFGDSPDLILADQEGQVVSIVANDGRGGFSLERQDIFIGHAITAVLPLDVDADGDIDIAVADGDSPSVTVLLNNDESGFNARTSVAVEDGPSALTAANLNDDGHSDLIVANEDAGTVSILLSDRQGGFSVPRQDILVGIAPIAVDVADYDADGDNDIFSANAGSRDVTILEGDGSGGFALGSRIPTVMQPSGLALSDLTRDVFADLVVSGDEEPFVSFFENEAGQQFRAKDVVPATAVALRVVIADMNGDGNNDIVTLGATSPAVRVFINEDTRIMDPPRPPTLVAAADVPRDLGRQIEISWEAPELDEQISRTTEYVIYRAADADGPYAEVGRRAAGERDFIDMAATLSQTFYYFVQAGNAAIQSANSDTVSAASRPAPFFELELIDEPRISVGDTLKVRALLTPAVHDVAGISLYLTYDDSALTLIDADSNSTAMVPFRLDTTLTAGSLVENRVHPNTTDKIDVSLTSLQISNGVQPVSLGEIWFRTLKDKTTPISIDDEDALNRRSAVVEQVTGNWILPFVPSRQTQVSFRDFQVSGGVELEGRAADNLGLQATITLVDSTGSSLESPLNDEDRQRALIQTTLTGDGKFELNQIPRGSYQVFAKTPSHLQGQVVGDTVTIGDSLRTTLSFRWMRSDSTTSSVLAAGDANNDNRINLADYGLLVRHFDANSADISVWDQARPVDFNGDNFVNSTDFFLFAQNFGEVGMGFAATVAKPTTPGWVAFDRDRQAIVAHEVGLIRGYALTISIRGSTPRAGQPLIDALSGLFSEDDSMANVWPIEGGSAAVVAVALRDPEKLIDGIGELARLDEAQIQGAQTADLGIVDVQVLRWDWSVSRPEIRRAQVLPASTTLLQNYPNPFNPSTIIPFSIGEHDGSSSLVQLEIFNLLGQRVRTLVDGRMRPGAYVIAWDGRDRGGHAAASGIYIYRLSITAVEANAASAAASSVLSRRLLLLH